MRGDDSGAGDQDLAGLVDQLGALSANAEALAADPPTSLEAIFADDFVAEHTSQPSFRAFLAESPWTIESRADFADIPEADFDRYVERETAFPTWAAFFEAATQHWFRRKLGF